MITWIYKVSYSVTELNHSIQLHGATTEILKPLSPGLYIAAGRGEKEGDPDRKTHVFFF